MTRAASEEAARQMVNRQADHPRGAYKMHRKSTATTTKRGYVTMSRRPTKYNVYCVRKDDAVVFESVILSEAQAVRRDCAGELVTVPRDTSPGLS